MQIIGLERSNLQCNTSLYNNVTAQTPLLSFSNIEYNKLYRNDIVNSYELSFELIDQEKTTKAIFYCYRHELSDSSIEYSNFGMPIICHSVQLDVREEKLIQRHLRDILDTEQRIVYEDLLIDGDLSQVSLFLLSNQKDLSPKFYSIVDLTRHYDEIRMCYRKSYKSLVNKGKKEFGVTVFDSTNIYQDVFKSFQDLHLEDAGRKTRSDETWKRQYQMIENNEAILIISFKNELIAGGAFFMHGNGCSYYGVSASKPSMKDDNSIAHVLIDRAVEHYKNSEYQMIILGEFVNNPFPDQKLYNLSLFKSGFSNKKIIRLSLQR